MPRRRPVDKWSIKDLLNQFDVSRDFLDSRRISIGFRFPDLGIAGSEFADSIFPDYDTEEALGVTPGIGRAPRTLNKSPGKVNWKRIWEEEFTPTLGDDAQEVVNMFSGGMKDQWREFYNPFTPMDPAGIKDLELWRARLVKSRARYYSWWDPSSFGKEFAASKLGFVTGPSGKAYIAEEADTKNIRYGRSAESEVGYDLSEYEARMASSGGGETADAIQDEIVNKLSRAGAGTNDLGMDISGVEPFKWTAGKTEVSQGEIAMRAAEAELNSGVYSYDRNYRGAAGRLIKPSQHGANVYLYDDLKNARNMRGFGEADQTPFYKFTELSGEYSFGGNVDINGLNIVGKFNTPELGQFDEIQELMSRIRMNQGKLEDFSQPLEELLSRLMNASKTARPISRRKLQANLRTIRSQFRKISKMNPESSKFKWAWPEFQTYLNEEVLGRASEEIKYSETGYQAFHDPISGTEAIDELLRNSRAGDIYKTDSGLPIMVSPIESAGEAYIKTSAKSPWGGRSVPLSELNARYSRVAANIEAREGIAQRFQLMAVREPGTYRIGEKEVYLPNAVNLYTGAGEYAGRMEGGGVGEYASREGELRANELRKDVKSGYLGLLEGEFTEKIEKYGTGDRYLTAKLFGVKGSYWGEVMGTHKEGGKLLTEFNLGGIPHGEVMNSRWKRFFANRNEALAVDEVSVRKFKDWHPALGREIGTFYARSESAAAKAAVSRRLNVGLTIAAGSLLLLGASKLMRGKPMSEKDVPASQYGAVQYDRPTQPNRIYTPTTRITPNNTGYMTNIDMESTDTDGNGNHRVMANTASSLSTSLLGAGKINTSVNIMDESSRGDMASTERHLNRQLSL